MSRKLQLNKEQWKKVCFGDVVEEIKLHSAKGDNSTYKKLVGLEHIESEDIHLRNYSENDGTSSFSKTFKKGDVLFGRRRAYLRKAAQAQFEGICSGDIIVMRAKKNLLQEILPFLVHSNDFFDWAIKHSAGGLSPRVKFKDLAKYELLLPPMEEQEKIVELLSSVDLLLERKKATLSCYNNFLDRYINDSVSGELSRDKENWHIYSLDALGETFGGLSGKSKKDFGSTGAKFVTYMNVFSNYAVNLEQVGYVHIDDGEHQNELRYGDILFTGSSETPHELGMCSVLLDNVKEIYLNSFCFGFRLFTFNKLLPEYAKYLMRGKEVRHFMKKHAQGSTRYNLSKTTLKKKLQLLLPNIKVQKEISKDIDQKVVLLTQIRCSLKNLQTLQKSLINQIF